MSFPVLRGTKVRAREGLRDRNRETGRNKTRPDQARPDQARPDQTRLNARVGERETQWMGDNKWVSG
jgi:hypothetical protein